MAEQQDPEIPDVPEHDLSEEDMSSDTLWYELGDELLPDLLRSLTIWSRFDEAMLRLKSPFDKLW